MRATRVLLVAAIVAGATSVVPAARAATPFAPECAPPSSAPRLTVGAVDCLRFASAAIGGTTAVSYYVPPACDPARRPAPRCPVLYYLHGTDGSYREGTGPKGGPPSAWVRALTSGPPVDPRTTSEPWRYADTRTWVPKPALDLIVLAPHGLTVPGGYGPLPDQNPFWFDWNPRYAKGGDTPRYDTPAPRFHDFLVRELVPYVDATFPTGGGREQRAIVGYSMGGIGALANGLRHPDVFASVGSRSGGGFPYGATTGLAPAAVPGASPPAPVPYVPLPGAIPSLVPEAAWANVLYTSVASVGFGDAVADAVWWRQSQPAELVTNARARAADGRQSVHLSYFVNDAVPRRIEDLQGNPMAIGFEVILMPTNLWLEQLFDRHGVERTFDVGPGTHAGAYAVPYFRQQLERQYARLRHRDGGGAPPPPPVRFDYRSTERSFSIWGWQVRTERAAREFLYLTDVSCAGFTARGTGAVRIVPPRSCGSRVGGREVRVDLGPSQPTDEPVTQAAGSDGWGRTVHVTL